MHEIIVLTRQGLGQLTDGGRRTLYIYVTSLVAISLLDGLAILGLSQLISGANVVEILPTESVALLAGGVIILFVAKSILSSLATFVTFKEFAKQEVQIGLLRFDELNESDIERRFLLDEGDYYNTVDRGPTALVQNFLASVAGIVAESFSGLVILSVVFYLQPTTAISTAFFFTLIAYVQHSILSKAQSKSGQEVVERVNSTYRLLNDAFHLSKIMKVYEPSTFRKVLETERSMLAQARFRVAFISAIPRYFMESILAIGLMVVVGASWIINGEDSVLPAFIIFVAAGFRLLPIINRIQGLILVCIGYAPLSRLGLGSGVLNVNPLVTSEVFEKSDVMATDVVLELQDVSYSYPSTSGDAVSEVNFQFEFGKQYALVGPSGSGKTTLVDICLGILTPRRGKIFSSSTYNVKNGYVPQVTHITSANIGGNVALEWSDEDIVSSKVIRALAEAKLEEHFKSMDESFDHGEMLTKLSGGQAQRLGLARALYRESNFLVLDEATSALDAVTESEIMETVDSLRGRYTTLIVAHRLSTIKNADEIIYLKNGKILGSGNFLELQRELPEFEEQVRLGQLDLI